MTNKKYLNEFDEWYNKGIELGFITPVFCVTHDGGMEYWTDEEAKEWEEGGDPCAFVVRLIESDTREVS